MNPREREQRERDYADPLCQFLGGDAVALGIFRALRRDDIATAEDLREWYWRDSGGGQYGLDPGYFIRDVKGIGPAAMGRVDEKMRQTTEVRSEG